MEVTNYLLTGMILQVPLISSIWRVKKLLGDEEVHFHAALGKAHFLMLILTIKLNLPLRIYIPVMLKYKLISSCSIMNKWASGIPRSKCFHAQIGDEINTGEQPVKCKLSIKLFFWIRHWGKFLWFLIPCLLIPFDREVTVGKTNASLRQWHCWYTATCGIWAMQSLHVVVGTGYPAWN